MRAGLLSRAAKNQYRWYREAKWFEGKKCLFSTYSYTLLRGNLGFILVVVQGSKIYFAALLLRLADLSFLTYFHCLSSLRLDQGCGLTFFHINRLKWEIVLLLFIRFAVLDSIRRAAQHFPDSLRSWSSDGTYGGSGGNNQTLQDNSSTGTWKQQSIWG